MHVECANVLKDTGVYPLGTKFKLNVKLKKPKVVGDKISIYSSYRDQVELA